MGPDALLKRLSELSSRKYIAEDMLREISQELKRSHKGLILDFQDSPRPLFEAEGTVTVSLDVPRTIRVQMLINLKRMVQDADLQRRDMLFKSVRDYAEKGLFSSHEEFLTWLTKLRELGHKGSSGLGSVITPNLLFELALLYRQNLNINENPRLFLSQLKNAGFHPGMEYLDYRSSKFPYFIRKVQPMLNALRDCYPQYYDYCLLDSEGGWGSEELIEPVKFDEEGATNLHDIGMQTKDGQLESSQQLNGRSTTKYLEDLKTRPHKFSPLVWGQIAENNLNTFDDLKLLFAFATEALTATGLSDEEAPYLAHARTHAQIAILDKGLEYLGKKGVLDMSQADVRTEIHGLIRSIPRVSHRNAAVTRFLGSMDGQAGVEEQLSCLSLLETEPAEQMVQEVLGEMKQHREKKCKKLEDALSKAASTTIAEESFETFGCAIISPAMYELQLAKPKRGSKRGSENQLEFSLYKAYLRGRDTYLRQGGRAMGDLAETMIVIPTSDVRNLWRPTVIHDLKKSGGNILPYETPTNLRYSLLKQLKKDKPAPQTPLRTKSKAVELAESCSGKALDILGAKDPLTCNPFAAGANRDLLHYVNEILLKAQPSPTPLRDDWILRTIENYSKTVAPLELSQLRALRPLMYLPENAEQISLRIWDIRREQIAKTSAVTQSQVIAEIRDLFPYYSLNRNRVLEEARQVLPKYDYYTARWLDALRWRPGMPVAIPSTAHLGAESAVDFQAKLLKTFEDFDVVEFLLYSYGIVKDKPWSVEYMEYALGYSLEKLHESNNSLSSQARRAFLHRIFGGREGLFAREDSAALLLLSKRIADFAVAELKCTGSANRLVEEVSKDLFYRAGFSAYLRTEFLSALLDWVSASRGQAVNDDLIADLLLRLFVAGGSAGTRVGQDAILEPSLFSDELRGRLRRLQDEAFYGSATIPFHILQAEGVHDAELGPPMGAGSMAENHRLVSLNGRKVEGALGKFSRPDTLSQVRQLAAPLRKLAQTVSSVGYGWSESAIDSIIRSCEREEMNLAAEAKRTGMPVAKVIKEVLGGDIKKVPQGLSISFPVGDGKKRLELLIPEAMPELAGKPDARGRQRMFVMSILGPEFQTLSAAERERLAQGKDLAGYLAARGISLSELATAAARIFVISFLDCDTLFCDPHFGNYGSTAAQGSDLTRMVLCDFGSVIENYPRFWKNWIIRLGAHAAELNRDEVRADLVEAALKVNGRPPEKKLLVELDRLLVELQKLADASNRRSHIAGERSLPEVLNELISFLYDKWPLPPEVRAFCESVRKFQREWGTYIPPQVIGQLLMHASSKAESVLKSAEEGVQRSSEAEQCIAELREAEIARTPEQIYDLTLAAERQRAPEAGSPQASAPLSVAQAKAALALKNAEAWLSSEEPIPEGASVFYYDEFEEPAQWKQQVLTQSCKAQDAADTKMLNFRFGMTMRTIRPGAKGYIDFEADGLKHRVSFDTLFKLLKPQTS